MNKHDKDNLRFLMTVDKKVLQDWYKQADEDDLVYAMELLAQFEIELTNAVDSCVSQDIEHKLEKMGNKFLDARAVLDKVRQG